MRRVDQPGAGERLLARIRRGGLPEDERRVFVSGLRAASVGQRQRVQQQRGGRGQFRIPNCGDAREERRRVLRGVHRQAVRRCECMQRRAQKAQAAFAIGVQLLRLSQRQQRQRERRARAAGELGVERADRGIRWRQGGRQRGEVADGALSRLNVARFAQAPAAQREYGRRQRAILAEDAGRGGRRRSGGAHALELGHDPAQKGGVLRGERTRQGRRARQICLGGILDRGKAAGRDLGRQPGVLAAQPQQAADAQAVLPAERGADLLRREGAALPVVGEAGVQRAARRKAGGEQKIQRADGLGAATAFQQRQRQQRVDGQRLFRHKGAPILRQRRAEERAVQRVVEVGGEHRVERLVKRRVRLPVAQRGAAQEAQRGAKRLLELAEAAVDRVAHGEQRAGQVVRRVAGGIGLAQRLGAEGADGLRGLTDEGVPVLREAAIRLREPDIQPRRIKRKARRGQRRGEKHARVFEHQRAQGQRALAGKQRARALTEQLHIRPHAGIEPDGHGALEYLHIQRRIRKRRRRVADEEQHRHVAQARLIERLRGKRQKRRRGGRRAGSLRRHGLRRNRRDERNIGKRRNAHAAYPPKTVISTACAFFLKRCAAPLILPCGTASSPLRWRCRGG